MPDRSLVTVGFIALFLSASSPVPAAAQEAASSRPQPPPAPADVAKPPADATKSESGLYTKMIEPGSGTEHPGPADVVTVLYTGWTTDGRVFDSSVLRNNKPSTFPLNTVLPGWSEGVQLMVKGETRRLWVPEELAFKGAKGKPAGMVVFDIQLVDFKASPTAAPPDVAAPPADAKKTSSGLYYKVLREGTGTKHPNRFNQVTVNYTGWQTDGKMFDSSLVRGEPATFPLDKVIRGWTEGVALMVEGEKTRFWIPENLAYQGREPKGMLVFDVELIKIQ
jgi:peptidylprolyl isomerase